MARQGKDQVVTRYIGIDPGSSWCGVAHLYVCRHNVIMAGMSTLSVADRALVTLVDEVVPSEKATVVVESFQSRPVGFNRFSAGITLKILGALEYRTKMHDEHEWALVPTGDPTKELSRFGLVPFLSEWNKICPLPRNQKWDHAFSAWRILAQYLLTHDLKLLERLRAGLPNHITVLQDGFTFDSDLIAPTIKWLAA